MSGNVRAVFAKHVLRQIVSAINKAAATRSLDVPKGFLPVYVGEQKKRFVVPVSYLNEPPFLNLLRKAEGEFGFNHPMGGLTIPCSEDAFFNVTSSLSGS